MLLHYYKKFFGTERRTFKCLTLLGSASILAFYSSEYDVLELLLGSCFFNLYYFNAIEKGEILRPVYLSKE